MKSARRPVAIIAALLFLTACSRRASSVSAGSNQTDPTATAIQQSWQTQDRLVRAHLDGYGWVNQANGVVHIPIERAMNLIVAEQSSSGPPSDRAPVAEFQKTDDALRREGRQLFHQYGCSVCHGPDAVAHAPSLVGIYGQRVRLSDDTFVLADDRYLHDSILHASRQIVAGYTPRMPDYTGILPEPAVLKLIAYLKSFPAADGTSGPATGP